MNGTHSLRGGAPVILSMITDSFFFLEASFGP